MSKKRAEIAVAPRFSARVKSGGDEIAARFQCARVSYHATGRATASHPNLRFAQDHGARSAIQFSHHWTVSHLLFRAPACTHHLNNLQLSAPLHKASERLLNIGEANFENDRFVLRDRVARDPNRARRYVLCRSRRRG